MKTRKKRNDGWTSGRSTIKQKRQYIIDECLEPGLYYDHWKEHRDGLRMPIDRTKILKKGSRDHRDNVNDWDKKNKIQLKIRTAMKQNKKSNNKYDCVAKLD